MKSENEYSLQRANTLSDIFCEGLRVLAINEGEPICGFFYEALNPKPNFKGVAGVNNKVSGFEMHFFQIKKWGGPVAPS